MRFADSHIHHLETVGREYPDQESASLLLSCTAQCSEWDGMSSATDGRVVRFYGVHPWYADQWSIAAKDRLKNILEDDPNAHVGEIGLDNKHPDLELQAKVFTSQVMLAGDLGRSVNVHNLGCDGELVRILKRHGNGCRSVILHSFKGPTARQYSGIDCYFSLNPRMMDRSPERIRTMVDTIPRDRILLETDAPHVSRNFVSMGSFITELAGIMDMEPGELASLTEENARRSVS